MPKIVLILLLGLCLHAEDNATFDWEHHGLEQLLLLTDDPMQGLIVDNLLVNSLIIGWGVSKWDWGTEPLHVRNEGWFDEESKTGGSDKTGHFFMTYLLSRMLTARFEARGWDRETAALYGVSSGMLAMTLLEIGDGTSPYGFSPEDLLSDAAGAVMAYLLKVNPRLDDFIDIRFEYFPTHGYAKDGDLTTDYSGMKHLVAFQPAGFDALKSSWIGLLEVQLGYYTRGFRSYDTMEESRNVYVGVGLSLSELARRSRIKILQDIFEYYQPGGTYVETRVWSK